MGRVCRRLHRHAGAARRGILRSLPRCAKEGGGEICCAFYEYGRKTPGGDLLVDLTMAVSYDRGATFTGRMVLSEQPWDPAVDKPISPGATRGALGLLTLG